MPIAAKTARGLSSEWETPPALFNTLHSRYKFTVDAAASDTNHLLPRYRTIGDNCGLFKRWDGERVWLNPPYGRAIAPWINKCCDERHSATLIAALVPAYTDTSWFHDALATCSAMFFIRGRLSFLENGIVTQPARFPSAVIVWSDLLPPCDLGTMDRNGNLLS